jgi:NADH-quinone oxidoreductase subunit J
MSSAGTALFLLAAFGALISAVGTVFVKSPIRAAMCLLMHILMLSGLFLTLHAHLLAALQILIYAGAVVVLFVFVIMMIGPGVTDTSTTRGLISKTAATAGMAILTFALAAVLGSADPVRALIECDPNAGSDCNAFGGVAAFSRELYGDDLVPFELISALLTVAIVGAIAVARGRSKAEAASIKRRLQEGLAVEEATARAAVSHDAALTQARVSGGE